MSLPWPLASFACERANSLRQLTLAGAEQAAFTHADFVQWVGQWQAPLQALASKRIALFETHPGRFAASLWAIWHAGKVAILPGDQHPATLAALDQLGCARMGELAGALALPSCKASQTAQQSALPTLDVQSAQIGLFTSGSQGEPQLIEKTLRQLDAEVHTLEASFGALLTQSQQAAPLEVWTTVSHQHIYGLLFAVLWCMASGRVMGSARLQYSEDLVRHLRAPAILVATPAHLKRLDAQLEWTPVQQQLQAVFSSGGPLPYAAAQTCERLLQQLPLEIFGSSETGGIAWRQARAENSPWHAFSNVQWRSHNGLLQLRSAHLADPAWYLTADRIEALAHGSFALLGRSDRIVKIEEKRVSLTAIEHHLLQHPSVQEAKVLVLPTAIGERTAAVVVLHSDALPTTPAQRHALTHSLREWLRSSTEAVAIPKRWRCVPALPCNEQGKTTQLLLAQLFDSQRHSPAQASATHRPAAAPSALSIDAGLSASMHGLLLQHGPAADQIQCLHYSPVKAGFALQLSPDLQVFRGHFPGSPILPGVAQLDWVLSLGQQVFDLQGQFQGLQALKFVRPITPDMTVHIDLELHAKEAEQSLHFRLYSHDAAAPTQAIEHASGRAHWRRTAPSAQH